MRLKNRDVILQSKIIDIAEDTEKLEITTECNWNNHDIEIYKNDRLMYINTNIYYMRDIRSTIITSEGAKRIPINSYLLSQTN